MTDISIIEFPSNLGLKEPYTGHEPGIKGLPDWLRKHGFHDRIEPKNICRLDPPGYTTSIDNKSGVRNADNIILYARGQAKIISSVLAGNFFPLVIGGDCSILIGNAIALKNNGRYGLFFLDGHTDFIGPDLSQTGGAAGMDLAIVTGTGHNNLTNIDNLKPYIHESFVWCVGNREYDPAYVEPILNSQINYYDLPALRRTGIEKCVSDFFIMVRSNELDGFWIHLDVDVLNDSIMPAVDSREKDGLSYEEFSNILHLLLKDKKAKGLEITILDPELDPTGQYTKQFVEVFCTLFNKMMKAVN